MFVGDIVVERSFDEVKYSMSRHSLRFRILLIDDDYDMNTRLERILSGCRVSVSGGNVVVPQIDRLDVDLEERSDKPGYWKIKDSTLERVRLLSELPQYDLVITDFGLVPPQVQKALWGEDNTREPSTQEVKNKILTIRDLKSQFEEWSASGNQIKTKNLFTAARRVLLISMVSNKSIEAFGPVVPNRSQETQGAFPSAQILPLDSRHVFFGDDKFYEIYDSAIGRQFYRYILGTYSIRIVELEMLKHALPSARQMRVRRSVFNIATFAGAVAAIGVATQYLSNTGLQLISQGRAVGWWIMVTGLASLVLGAVVLSLTFEWFARRVVQWVGPEEDFTSE